MPDSCTHNSAHQGVKLLDEFYVNSRLCVPCCMCMSVVRREMTPVRSRYDSCASSALSSCLSIASSTRSVRSASPQRYSVSRYRPSASVTASPYEYDMVPTSSSESVARHSGIAGSDGDLPSCKFSGRGSVSRFLAARHRDSVDSGLTSDSASFNTGFRRASDPLLNNAETSESSPVARRCPSAASAPGTAAHWPAHRANHRPSASLMSSHSSIATNQSDDVDVKYTPPSAAADQFVGDLIIPSEMQEFIDNTYSGSSGGVSQAAACAAPRSDSMVADSPAAVVDSTSALGEPARRPPSETKPAATLASCMYEGQAGRNTAPMPGISPRPQQIPGVMGTVPVSSAAPRSASGLMTSYFASPSVPQAYQNGHEVQVSQVSQSWRAEATGGGPRSYGGSGYCTSGGTLDDMAVRHRRNPHQMPWWTRIYGYQHGYRPNYALPTASIHPPRTAVSFVPSQMSPGCNQV